MAGRPYYTLVTRDGDGLWSPQFGDFALSVVQDELSDYREHGHRRCNMRILCTGATQAEIDAGVDQLNSTSRLQLEASRP